MTKAPVRPRFHHADQGTPESTWLGDPRWDHRPVVDAQAVADAYDRVVVLSAHPDDETLAVGGLVAALSDAGATVLVAVLTSGEASHPQARGWTPEQLAEVRREEVSRAVKGLAHGADLLHLGVPDGGIAQVERELRERLVPLGGPGTLLVAPWTDDGHPDHDALGRVARIVAASTGAFVAYYPLWLWQWGAVDDLPWALVHAVEPGLAALARKRGALREFRSQTAPLGPGPAESPVVTESVLARAHRPFEVLFADPGVLPERPRVPDLLARLPFDAMFDAGDDPWQHEHSFYEERRRLLVTAALGREHYSRVLEIGCGTGLLTRGLARRAGAVCAMDISARALEVARRDAPEHVTWRRGRAPDDIPEGPFDLVVVSEVGYFLTPLELTATLRLAASALDEGGELVLVDWLHPTSGIPLDGPLVHQHAARALPLPLRAAYRDADVAIDVWGGPASVAADEGIR